ncbi:MAG: NAD+ synthase, partial [Fidelibacterota bacterium]
MIAALCQINPVVGDFRHNREKILSFYRQAVLKGADLVIFPELSVTGYPPQDLLLEPAFVRRNLETLETLAREITTIPAIVGFVRTDDSQLYNSAAVIRDGSHVATYDKVLLPTYDVFDEDRYFTAGKEFTPVSLKIGEETLTVGLQICEDLWDRGYDCKVSREMVRNGAQWLVNISASPFSEGKRFERMELITEKTTELNVPFVYCNLVGAQDDLIFDGHSLVFDGRGNLLAEGKQFEEDLLIVNLSSGRGVEPRPFNREEELFNGLVLGTRDYFRKTGHSRCVIGLSGGVDSALTACIATEALGKENVVCIFMPSPFSSESSVRDAKKLTENLEVELLTLPIDRLMNEYDRTLKPHFQDRERDVTEENVQARIRGNLLMAFSNKFGYLVLSTGNKTELALGYCTLYGDMSGGLAVISDLTKTDVYAVAEWYNGFRGKAIIPETVLTRTPSAELAEGQVDPFDYSVVSPLVEEIVENRRSKPELIDMGFDGDLVDRIYALIRRAEFKRRQAAPGLRV